MPAIIQKNLIYIIAAIIILIMGIVYFFIQKNSLMPGEKENFNEQKLIESLTAPGEPAEMPAKTLKNLTAPKPYKSAPQEIINNLTAPAK